MTVQVRPQVYLDPKGDVEKEKHLVGFALNQRNILNNLMSFNNLQQDRRKVLLADGSVIDVQSCFGVDKVFISSPKIVTSITDETIPRYIAYVIAIGEGGTDEWTAAFAWDITNNGYATIADNNYYRTNEIETYYINGDGEKIISGPGYPRIWNVSSGDIFSLYRSISFEGLDGEVVSVKNAGTTQIVEVEFNNHSGKAVKFNYYSPPGLSEDGLSTRYYGINGFATTDDYVVNTSITGDFLYAKVLSVIDDTKILIDTQIFDLYPGHTEEIIITPFLPLFHAVTTETWMYYNYNYYVYTPSNEFARYQITDYSVAPDVTSTSGIGDGSLGGYVGGTWETRYTIFGHPYWYATSNYTANLAAKHTASINTGNETEVIFEGHNSLTLGLYTGYNNAFMGSVTFSDYNGATERFSVGPFFYPWLLPTDGESYSSYTPWRSTGSGGMALFNEHCIIQVYDATLTNTPDVRAQTLPFTDPFLSKRMPTTDRSTEFEDAIENLATTLKALNDSPHVKVGIRLLRRY